MTARLKNHSKQAKTQIYVVKGLSKSLLGQPAIEQLHQSHPANRSCEQSVLRPTHRVSRAVHWTGEIGRRLHIQLKEGAKPFALSTPRRVAVPLLGAVKEELQTHGETRSHLKD